MQSNSPSPFTAEERAVPRERKIPTEKGLGLIFVSRRNCCDRERHWSALLCASEFFILLNNELNVSWRPSSWDATVRIGGHNGAQHEDPWVIPQLVRKASGSDHRFVSCYVESFGRFGGAVE